MGTFTKKVASAVVAITTSVSMLGGGSLVAVAGAQSVTDLQAQINALLAQIALLSSSTTTTASCSAAPTPSLTTGSQGAQVSALQTWLIANGYAIPAGATGYFGAQTVAAVKAFQVAKGITPAAGYYGPKTAAAVQAMCSTTTGPMPTVPGTGLSVSTAIDNPTSQSIAKGATRLVMMKVNVAGNGTLNTISFHRYGAGAASDFTNVYLYDGDVRLTSGRSVNSTSNMVTFTGLNLAVAGVKTLSLVVDFSASAGSSNQNGFELVAATDVMASVGVMGSFPVRGNLFSVTGASVGGITIARTGSLTNPKVGQTTVKIAEFQLTASSVEDLWVRSLTLFNVGNVSRSGVSNFVLKQAGTTLATASAINSRDQIVLTFTAPFSLTKGSVRTFELYADLAGTVRANDTIRLYLENGADLYATGATYGAGVTVTLTAYDNGQNDGTDASWTTVEGGQVTIAYQGPSTTDYAVQQQDVTLATFNFTSANNIEVRNTRLFLDAGGTDADADTNDVGGLCNSLVANYTDIKFVDVTTGTVLTGSKDSTCAAGADDDTQTLVYTDVWNNNAGQTRQIKVTADIANFTPTATETVRAQWNSFGASDIKNLDNNLFVSTTDIVPSGNITGATHNIKSGSLTSSLAGTPVAQTYINGTQGVAMTGINFTAGTGKDVKITSVKVTAVGANTCATESDCVLTVQLFDGSTAVSDLKSISTSTFDTTFNNLTIMVAKGTTKTITLKVNLVTLGSVAGGTTLRFDVASASDVTAVDSDGNTVANSGTVTGPAHTITGSGTLSAVAAPLTTDTESRIVVANTNDVTVGGVRFGAANESLEIKKVRITIAAGNIDEVTGITLYNGSTVVGATTVPTSGGVADFSNVTGFTVPKDGNLTLTIKVNLNSTSNGADAGTSFMVTFDYDDNFEARGAGQTVITSVGSANIDGQAMVVNKSKITINEVALSTGILASGDQRVYAFTVAADAAGDVSLKQLKFTVIVTDNVGVNDTLTLGSFQLFRGSSPLNSLVDIHAAAGTDLEAANLAEGTSTAIVTWTTEEGITAGSSNTYYLNATPGGFATPADDDRVKVTMANDTAASTAGNVYLVDLDETAAQFTAGLGNQLYTAVNGTPGASVTDGANIIWSDNSVVAHASTLADQTAAQGGNGTDSTSSGDWFNGYLIRNTLSFSGATLIN